MANDTTMKTTFTNDQIKAIKAELARLKPAKPVRADGKMTLKDAIMELAPMLVKMRERGFTSKELAEHLEKRGIVIKASTLTRYLHSFVTPEASANNATTDAEPVAPTTEMPPVSPVTLPVSQKDEVESSSSDED